MLILANNMLHKKELYLPELLSPDSIKAFKIKYKDAKQNAIAKPSRMPPLNSWVMLNNENLDKEKPSPNRQEKNTDLINLFAIKANTKPLIAWIQMFIR